MDREDDAQLVHAVLSGDDVAFDILVGKYQKSVHALVWQKIGDFHYAEDITQDTFLRAYQKPFNTEKSEPISWVVVCHRESALSELATETKICEAIAIVGGHTCGRSSEI